MNSLPYLTILIIAVLGFILFVKTGWSSVTVTHVSPSEASEGIYFYEPRPYLLVTRVQENDAYGNKIDNLTNQIIWLPDPSRRFKVMVNPGWGAVNGSVRLLNGWMLESLGAQPGSKSPDTMAVLGGLPPAVAAQHPARGGILAEGLYKITIAPNGDVSFERTGATPAPLSLAESISKGPNERSGRPVV